MYLQSIIGHLKTICRHKYYVGKYCFGFRLYWQGITHDLSKFNPIEFFGSIKYFTGTRSPIDKEKDIKGYSDVWMHHYHHNKHHWVHWIDFNNKQEMVALKMPYKYVMEMVADWIGAGITYSINKGELQFSWNTPYNYYKTHIRKHSDTNFHPHTRLLLDIIMIDIMNLGITRVQELEHSGRYKCLYELENFSSNDKDSITDKKAYEKLIKEYYEED